MPKFLSKDEDPGVLENLRVTHREAPVESASFGEAVGAAFRTENLGVQLYTQFTEERPEAVEGYDPIAELTPAELTYADQFEDSRSPAETAQIRQRLERQRIASDTLEAAPASIAVPAVLLAAGLDIDTLVPFGAVAKLRKGKVLAGALVGGATGAGVELGLAERQPDREQLNVLISGLIGGGFGAAGGALLSRGARAATDTTNEFSEFLMPGSLGAAGVNTIDPKDTVIAGTVTRAAAKAISKLGKIGAIPGISLLASGNPAARQTALELVDIAVMTEGALRGTTVGASVETLIKGYDRFIAEGVRIANIFAPQSQFGRKAFANEVGMALRRGDVHPDAAVEQAAQAVRKSIYEPLKDAAVKAGLLPEDVEPTTALSYFTRVYNRRLIHQNSREFTQIIKNWLRQQDPDLEDIELEDIATGITNRIIGSDFTKTPFLKIPAERGPLKERTFNIPDTLIEKFLVSDVREVIPTYVRTLAPQVELARKYGQANPLEEIILPRIQEAADAARRADPDNFTKIQKEADVAKDNITALVNRITGTTGFGQGGYSGLGIPARALRVGKKFTNTILLSNVVISSLPDITRPIMEDGVVRTMRVAFTGLTDGFKAIRMGKEQAQTFGTALDSVLSSRAKAFTEIGEPFAPDITGFERGVDRAEETFFRAAGINWWNTQLKGLASATASTRILETAQRVAAGTAKPADLGKLARAGISKETAAEIAAESQNWVRQGGAIFANIEDWANPRAAEAMRNAVISDVDKTIITPGAGDLPVWFDNKYLSVFSHLKSFAFASTSRMLLSGMQQANGNVLVGVTGAVALGALSAHIKDIIAGREPNRDLRQWVVEGIDRSGVLGMLVDADDLGAKITKGAFPGVLNTLKGEDTRRFQRTDTLEALAPTVSTIQRARRGIQKTINDGDPSQLQKILPLNNHFLLVGGLEALDRLQDQ